MHVLNIVLPVFLVIGLGYGLRRPGFLDVQVLAAISRLVFYVAAPALLARATAGNSLDETFNPPVLAAVIAATILVGAATYALCFRSSNRRRGVIAQGAIRSNMVFVGLPIIIYAYGEESVNAVAVLISFMVIFYNFQGVVLLILPHRNESARMSTILAGTTLNVLKNPLIIACVAGLLLNWFGVPDILFETIDIIGAGGLGLALLAVGAGMNLGQAAQHKMLLTIGVLTRLIGMPTIVIAMSWLVGLDGLARTVAIIAGAVPTAASAYVMARKMGGNAELMSSIVTFQVIVAFFTLPLFIYIAELL